jgi:hypothetical protein
MEVPGESPKRLGYEGQAPRGDRLVCWGEDANLGGPVRTYPTLVCYIQDGQELNNIQKGDVVEVLGLCTDRQQWLLCMITEHHKKE